MLVTGPVDTGPIIFHSSFSAFSEKSVRVNAVGCAEALKLAVLYPAGNVNVGDEPLADTAAPNAEKERSNGST